MSANFNNTSSATGHIGAGTLSSDLVINSKELLGDPFKKTIDCYKKGG